LRIADIKILYLPQRNMQSKLFGFSSKKSLEKQFFKGLKSDFAYRVPSVL